MRPKEERLIPHDQVMELPKRHFFLRTYSRLYRGITDDSPEPYINVRFPNINVDEAWIGDEDPGQEKNQGQIGDSQ